MTQQEFEQRVGMSVNATEYASIENVYMASDLDRATKNPKKGIEVAMEI